MVKNKILDATTAIVGLLEAMNSEERSRVIQAALMLLGESPVAPAAPAAPAPPAPFGQPGAAPRGLVGSEKAFFDQKQPSNKGEELAVAARYREEKLDATQSTRDELKAVIQAARRNFDERNYRRDIENARVKGLFNRGKAEAVLSHFGQNVVDTLPDRDALKSLAKPKRTSGGRAPAKKVARKAPAKK